MGKSSSRGGTRSYDDTKVPTIAVPESVTQSDGHSLVAPIEPTSVTVGEAHPDAVGRTTVAHRFRCIGEVVVKGGMDATKLTLLSAVLSSGAMRSGLEDSAHQRTCLLIGINLLPYRS